MYLYTIPFVLSLLTHPFCSIAQRDADSNSHEWQHYTNANFELSYPSDLEIDFSGDMGTKFMLLSSFDSDSDLFLENINLIVQDLSTHPMNLDTYASLTETQIKTIIPDSHIESSRMITENNIPILELVYTGTLDHLHLKWLQHCFIVGNKAYVLTLSTEVDNFENYKNTALAIFKSFHLK